MNVKEYKLSALRNKIGYIPQKALLFTGTIADNLRYGKEDATLEEMERAIDIAQATEFVSQKPQGYDEPLSEGGTNFSGGQKQRLAIARAIIRNPEIYIFDDSFSALDYQTDANLRARLKKRNNRIHCFNCGTTCWNNYACGPHCCFKRRRRGRNWHTS
ncbi:ABC transporter, ATP-binding protein [Enterococcus faecalis TX0312]|nr:ABC transporter, ATP-binding protein [Enterococcus faecalis TX0312]